MDQWQDAISSLRDILLFTSHNLLLTRLLHLELPSTKTKNMNNTPNTKGGKLRRGRRAAPLSERLANVRSYPRFGSSALTGILR
jgi:hypothetical protein